jgi:hypothetical protein
MKYLIGVAFALAISTPVMGATEVVIPQNVLLYCEALKIGQTGTCDIKPAERRVIATKEDPNFQIWEVCPRMKDFDPGWRMEVMDEAHTQVFKCQPY